MRFLSSAIVPLFTSVALSQTISNEISRLPSCSLSCVTAAISEAGCGLTDYACQCGDTKSNISTSSGPCLVESCSTSDALRVDNILNRICLIQLGLPPIAQPPPAQLPAPVQQHVELRHIKWQTVVSGIGTSFPAKTYGSFTTTASGSFIGSYIPSASPTVW